MFEFKEDLNKFLIYHEVDKKIRGLAKGFKVRTPLRSG